MRKPAVSAVLSVLLLQILYVPSAGAVVFSDVQNTVYAKSVTALADEGIVQGYPDGTARPRGMINRAEVVAVIVRSQPQLKAEAEKYRQHMPSLPLFLDVSQNAWYAADLEAAFRHGIVKGYPDGMFRGQQLVRIEEAMSMISRAFGNSAAGTQFLTSPEIENVPGQWFTDVVSEAIAKNLLLKGIELRLNTAATRGNVFEMLYRMREVRRTNVAAFDDGQTVAQQPVQPQIPTPTPTPVVQQPQRVVPTPAPVVIPVSQPVQQPRQVTYPPMSEADRMAALQYVSSKPFAMAIPTLSIKDLVITHPTNTSTQDGVLAPLKVGVGHLFSYPGGGGKIMIYGHSSGYPWDLSPYTKVFRTVNKLAVGDRVYVTYNEKLYIYQVTQKKTIPAKDRSTFSPDTSGENLILYTCWPPDSISQRYLVFAAPIQVIDL